MKHINKLKYVIVVLFALSCTDSDDELNLTLSAYLQTSTFTNGGVIACAASDEQTNDLLTFFYPESGATDIRLYQTNDTNVDPNDFSNYQQIFIESDPFFNGYLGKFTQSLTTENWSVVTFKLDGDIKVSNPIRSRQISKPTVWTDAVVIDQSQFGMPKFTWENNAVGDNAIYFQVISDLDNNLISGTYTYDHYFQFYDLDNVVLNITTQAPLPLTSTQKYNFTLMDVSEDNWVNWVVLKMFDAL